MPTIQDNAPEHRIFDFFGKNDNFIEQLPKNDIYQLKIIPEFKLSIPPATSTY